MVFLGTMPSNWGGSDLEIELRWPLHCCHLLPLSSTPVARRRKAHAPDETTHFFHGYELQLKSMMHVSTGDHHSPLLQSQVVGAVPLTWKQTQPQIIDPTLVTCT